MQESICSKENVLKLSFDELYIVKKCQNPTFKVNFGCQKLIQFFQKKNYPRISIWETVIYQKKFSKLNF